MAAAASVTLAGYISNPPTGGVRQIGPLTLTSASANGQIQRTVLASGDNTITLPTVPAPTFCAIVLPSDNTATVLLKSDAGATGTELVKTGLAAVLAFNTSSLPTSFILNSSATQTGKVTEISFY